MAKKKPSAQDLLKGITPAQPSGVLGDVLSGKVAPPIKLGGGPENKPRTFSEEERSQSVSEGNALIRAREKRKSQIMRDQGVSAKEAQSVFEREQTTGEQGGRQVSVNERQQLEEGLAGSFATEAELAAGGGGGGLAKDTTGFENKIAGSVALSVAPIAVGGALIASGVGAPAGIAILASALSAATGLFSVNKVAGKPDKLINDAQGIIASSRTYASSIPLRLKTDPSYTREQAITDLQLAESNLLTAERSINEIIASTPDFFVNGGKDALIEAEYGKKDLISARNGLVEALAVKQSLGL